MTTNNHTDIAVGAAANAATINNPMGQLDAAIGAAVSTLTTTAKTLVGALNEIDAQVDVGINADGSFKAAAIIGALSSPNLAFDPYNRFYGPSSSAQDGRIRWYYTSAIWVQGDAGNPFGLNTVHFSATGGKRFYLDEMGLKVGDVISFGCCATVPSTRTIKLNYTFRDANGDIVSAVAGASYTGTEAAVYYKQEAVTIPATTAIIDVVGFFLSGSGDIDVYLWYVVRGSVVQTAVIAEGDANGYRAYAQIQNALDTSTDLTARLNRISRAFLGDAFARYYEVSSLIQDDNLRWYTPANITRNLNDTNNPFGLPTLTITPNASQRFVLSELGLDLGDVLSLGIIAKWAPGTAYKVAYAFRDSSEVVKASGSAAGSGTDGSATSQFISFENITAIPSGSYYLDVYAFRVSGTATVDVYGTFIVRASTIAAKDCYDFGYAQRLAPGSRGMKRETLAPEMNLHNLASWRQAQAHLYAGTAGKVAKVACIGDSITNLYSRWFKPLTLRLAGDVGGGQGGVGYISVNPTAYNALVGMPMFTSLARTGTWTDHDVTTTPVGQGFDGYDAVCTVDGGKYTIVAEMTEFHIYFVKDPAGGTFRHRVDGGTWSSNVLTNGVAAAGVAIISGLDGNAHTVEVEVNLAPVTLSGFEALDLAVDNRVVTLKAGVSGANTGHWVTATNLATWKQAAALLEPDLWIIWLGTNNSGNQSTYKAALTTIAANCRSAVAGADILLVSPYEPGSAHSYDNQGYADRIRELANTYDYISGLDMRAYIKYLKIASESFTDTTHINSIGGALAAGAIFRALKW